MSVPASDVPIVTIDGPSGSGKGTVSRAVARALGWGLLDSGALYRLVALAARRAQVPLDDVPALSRLAARFDIRFGAGPRDEEIVWLDGAEVTRDIRTETAGNDASKVAALPAVRGAARSSAGVRGAPGPGGGRAGYGHGRLPRGRGEDFSHREP